MTVIARRSPRGEVASEQAAVSGRGMLLVLCGAIFLDALDVSMKSVALPSIGDDLAMSTRSLQWVVSGYVLGFGGFLLLGGRASDLLGRRRVFLVSLAVFVVATGLGGFANSGTTLIVVRFVTGVSAAFTTPAGFSIITTSYQEGPSRNRALSIYTATGASGFSLGLVIGGLLTEVSWRWVFFAPVVMALAILIGALRLLPRPEPVPAPSSSPFQSLASGASGAGTSEDRGSGARGPGARRFDVPGAVSVTAAILLLVLTLAEAPEVGWGAARTVGSLLGVVALLAVFVAIERRSPAPLVRLGLLRSGAVVRANLGAMSLLGGWVSCLFIVTLYAQQVRGWSALETGLAVCPSGVVVVLLAPRLAPPLVARFGTAPVILAGLAASAAGYTLLLRLDAAASYVPVMLPAFLLVGLAFTLTYGPSTMAATDGVDPAEHGLAGGLVNTSFQVGPALVVAVVTAVVDTSAGDGAGPGELVDTLHAAMFVPLTAALVGVAVAAYGVARTPRARSESIRSAPDHIPSQQIPIREEGAQSPWT